MQYYQLPGNTQATPARGTGTITADHHLSLSIPPNPILNPIPSSSTEYIWQTSPTLSLLDPIDLPLLTSLPPLVSLSHLTAAESLGSQTTLSKEAGRLIVNLHLYLCSSTLILQSLPHLCSQNTYCSLPSLPILISISIGSHKSFPPNFLSLTHCCEFL